MLRKLGIALFFPTFLLAQDPGLSDDLTIPPGEAPSGIPLEGPGNDPFADPAPDAPALETPNADPLDRKASDLPEKGSQPSEIGSDFRDPFADAPAESSLPAAPAPFEVDPFAAPAPQQIPAPAQEFPAAPAPDSFAPPPMQGTPMPAPTPLPMPGAAQPMPFDFPPVDDVKGPVSADFIQSQKVAEEVKVKTWNAGFSLGGAVNLNRRNEQVHFEGSGGYRWSERLEIGGLVYYRVKKDSLIGFTGIAKYMYTMRNDREMRIDLLPLAGLGWTLRQPPSTNKFSEGRMNLRLGTEALFYPFPKFALTGMAAIETFLFALTTGGSGTNFFSSGLPTQMLITVGTRWEF